MGRKRLKNRRVIISVTVTPNALEMADEMADSMCNGNKSELINKLIIEFYDQWTRDLGNDNFYQEDFDQLKEKEMMLEIQEMIPFVDKEDKSVHDLLIKMRTPVEETRPFTPQQLLDSLDKE